MILRYSFQICTVCKSMGQARTSFLVSLAM